MSKNRVCAVIGCRNINYYEYKSTQNPKIKFFRFPRNKQMCIKWIEQLNRLDLYPILEDKAPFGLWLNYRVCSEHFTEHDYEKTHFKRQNSPYLLKSAVPTRNLGNRNEVYLAPGPIDEPIEKSHTKTSIEKSPARRIQQLEEKLNQTEALLLEQQKEPQPLKVVLQGKCDHHQCSNDFALDLYMKSPRIYKELSAKYSLPQTPLLYKWKFDKQFINSVNTT